MGQIRQSFPGGNRRFKKLLFSTVAAPVLQQQDYQTSLKLAFGKKPETKDGRNITIADLELAVDVPVKRFHGRSSSRLIA